MPPQLALLLTILFIFYLFIQDFRQKPNISSAVWIPCIWIMILGSRAVSQWLNPGAPFQGANDLIEGSPIDRAVFLLLMAAGLLVLWKRQIPWSQVFRNNVWLTLFFGYCAVSILWSDIPSLAFKRWIKGLGDPMMVLILLSEREPVRAIETVIKRCAYVLIPLSILFIKYYPHLGAGYSEWTGEAYYTGVTTGKNLLGLLCFVAGLFFVCKLIVQLGRGRKSGKKTDLLVTILFLLMIGWLFRISDSKTPLMSLVLGILVVVVLGFPNVKKYSGSFIVAGILVFSVLQLLFNISEILVLGAGRDPTLTGRTDLWEVLLNMNINPWIGAGFESFWLGERLEKLWAMYWFKPNEAHNGYLEIYLNLGGVGLFFLGGVFFSCYKNMRKSLMLSSEPGRKERVDQGHSVLHFPLASRGLRPLPPWRGKVGMGGGEARPGHSPAFTSTLALPRLREREKTDRRGSRKLNDPGVDFDFGRFGMGYVIAYLVYNITEAAFKGLNLVFVIFLIIAIEYQQPHPGMTHSSPASILGGPRKASKVEAERFITRES